MSTVLNPFEGILFIFLFGVFMVALAARASRGHKTNRTEFLVASRSLSFFPAAMSIAASWIWAPALLLGSQKAYEQGLPGAFWFIFPNLLSLIFFTPLAIRIRQLLPKGFTLPQYMRQRHGRSVHILYLIQFFVLQICSFAVQILAGSALIHNLTGLSTTLIALMLVAIALTYSTMGGIRASVATDVLQMILIFIVIIITVPWVLREAGGFSSVLIGLGGVTGEHRSLFDPWIAYSFGIPVTIGLLSGPIGDQQHWQRAYAMKSNHEVIKAFALGAVAFAIVPISLSLLGFVAANPAISGSWVIDSSQLIGPITVQNILPSFVSVLFSLMILSGLCSTLDSVLCACSSLAVVDLLSDSKKVSQSNQDDRRQVFIARLSMLITAIFGLLISLIPRLEIVYLFLFYGTWRASTMIPTIFTLFWRDLKSGPVFVAIFSSLLCGAPLFALGSLMNNPHLSVLGSLLVPSIGIIVCYLGTKLVSELSK